MSTRICFTTHPLSNNNVLSIYRHQALLSRFIVKISSFAYSLLTTFIVQNNLLLVASVMNDRMTFSKTTDFPGSSHTVVQLEVPYIMSLRDIVVLSCIHYFCPVPVCRIMSCPVLSSRILPYHT